MKSMLLDIIELPNRYSECDEALSTMLPRFDTNNADDLTWFGRDIPLDLFASDAMRKYKVIEQNGIETFERIFFMEDELDVTKKFWTSTKSVYPIQTKVFSTIDPMIGHTIKYVNGISEFNGEFFNAQLHPAVFERFVQGIPGDTTGYLNPYHVIIPSLDIGLIDSGKTINAIASSKYIDQWVSRDVRLCDITKNLGCMFKCGAGRTAHDLIERPFVSEEELCNISPFDHSWSMYELIMQLNDLAISDIRIEVNDSSKEINVSFSSRYSGLFDYSHIPGYEELRLHLARLTEAMLTERFREVAWTRIVIEKLWTEEVYITVNVAIPERSRTIETYYYIDLPVFILGTVGLN